MIRNSHNEAWHTVETVMGCMNFYKKRGFASTIELEDAPKSIEHLGCRAKNNYTMPTGM